MGNFKHRGNERFGDERGGSRFGGPSPRRDGFGHAGGRDSGRQDFQKKSWGERGAGNRENVMYKATCSDCGKSCEVPFRPSGEKPVYCNECFGGKRGQSTEGFVRKEFSNPAPARVNTESNKGNDDIKRQLEATNAKLERLIQAVDTLVRMKLAQQKEAVKDAPEVSQKAPAVQAPAKKEVAVKAVAKKVVKKAVAKKGKK